jgi:hypothetical protein
MGAEERRKGKSKEEEETSKTKVRAKTRLILRKSNYIARSFVCLFSSRYDNGNI